MKPPAVRAGAGNEDESAGFRNEIGIVGLELRLGGHTA